MFDVGALIFKIQTAGAQVFQKDLDQADQSIRKVEGSAKKAKPALEGQAQATDKVGSESAKAAPKQRQQAEATDRQVQAAKGLSLALIAAGAAVTALVTLSVVKFASFDAQMSNTAAAAMATRREQELLGDAALRAGADTAYSANEAAAAQEELVKAGQSVSEVIGGSLNGALSLAAAGQLAVARSAEIMATTLKQYKLPAEDAAHVSDVLASAAGKAQGSVDDMALALSYVGPVANSAGWSLEETAGTLAYFASQGQLGEKAGTSLRGVLATLQSPSSQAARTLEDYGIQVYTANGRMKDAAGLADALQDGFAGLTDQERQLALGRIFGNEQLLGATLLYEGGAEAIDEWTKKVDDAGYAAEQAARRQDNLAGDVEKLGGAFDTALIKTGSGANDVLRSQVQLVTELVDWYGELPEELHQGALMFGVVAGAVALTSGAALGLTARFTELRAQLERNNVSMGKTAAIGGAVGLALAGAITVVALLAQKQAEARAKAEGYADALESGGDAARKFAQENLQVEKSMLWLNFGSAFDNAEKLGISLETLTEAATGNRVAMAELNEVLDVATGGGQAAQDMADDLGISLLDLSQSAGIVREGIDEETEAQKRANIIRKQAEEATDSNTESTQTAAEAYLEAAGGAQDLNNQLQGLIDTINEANGVGQDAISANLDYRDALAEVDETITKAREGVDGYSLTLDTNSEAGRTNMGMLVGLAGDAQAAADAQFALDNNTDAYRATLESSRQALIDRAEDLGYTTEQATALADQIFRIPSETEWKMIADTSAALRTIEDFKTRYGTLRGTIVYRATREGPAGDGSAGGYADGAVVKFYGNGGTRRENHVAQFARAGEWRVWAEPETEGETYIPHAMSKRARSERILAETAAIFGGVYLPGGAAAPASTSPAAEGHTRGINLSFNGPFYSYDPTDLARQASDSLGRALTASGIN